MRGLPHRIMEHATVLPEATPLCPAALLHLGNRAAVDQALSRLARSGHLMRICQGVYMRPIETRFGSRAPRVGKALAALSALWGETIVPCGGAAAKLPWSDHAESGSRGLSHVRPPTGGCISAHTLSNCAMLRAGNWRPRTAGPETSSAPWLGSVPRKSSTALKPLCPRSQRTIGTSLRPRGPSCLSGWRNR